MFIPYTTYDTGSIELVQLYATLRMNWNRIGIDFESLFESN